MTLHSTATCVSERSYDQVFFKQAAAVEPMSDRHSPKAVDVAILEMRLRDFPSLHFPRIHSWTRPTKYGGVAVQQD